MIKSRFFHDIYQFYKNNLWYCRSINGKRYFALANIICLPSPLYQRTGRFPGGSREQQEK